MILPRGSYHKDLLQDVRIHPTLRPHDMELTQLTPVRCHGAGLLDGVYLQQPMEEVLNSSGGTFLQRLERI